MSAKNIKTEFLSSLKAKGWSSPSGVYWDGFCKHIKRHANDGDKEALVNPLILGGSIASHMVKHERLSEQLDWSIRHGCFDQAIVYLKGLPESAWNISTLDDWDEEHPWTKGEW